MSSNLPDLPDKKAARGVARSTGARATAFRHRYGPWAVVRGASDGVGRAIAIELAGRGLNLLLVARRGDVLRAMAARSECRHVEVRTLALDLSQPGGTGQILAATRDLDVGLVAACAGFGTSGSFLQTDVGQECAMVDVNCRAVLTLVHHFAPRLANRRRGGLVLMSSLLAFQGVPRAANYAATKAYVQSLAEGLARELAPVGVDVVASAPGPVLSGFGVRANMRLTRGVAPEVVATATLDALGRQGLVRPGALSKLLESSLAPLPRGWRVRILATVMAAMTRHQQAAVSSSVAKENIT